MPLAQRVLNMEMTEKVEIKTKQCDGAIGKRVFELLQQRKMTQKEFSKRTGIKETTISSWKSTGQNPGADKIMSICRVLDVTPQYLLEGFEGSIDYIVQAGSEEAAVLEVYHSLDIDNKNRLMGYLEALKK